MKNNMRHMCAKNQNKVIKSVLNMYIFTGTLKGTTLKNSF